MVDKIKMGISASLFVVSMLLSTTLHAALTLSVDRNPVALDESFTLTLSSDESLDGTPDFTWIDNELNVINRQQNSHYQMINGDFSRSTTWTMTVLPKQSGAISIPPVKVGDSESNSIALMVKERVAVVSAPEDATQREGIFLQIEAEEGELFVQQQMLYTIKLFLAHDANMSIGSGSSLSEPEIDKGEAVIKRLGEDSNYQTIINGKTYSVIERRYAFYPQQSGLLSIKPVMFDGRMVLATTRGRSVFDSLQQRSQIKRITSQTIEREVKSIPETYQGRIWLPAKSVQLVDEWPDDENTMVVGEPVTRTLALIVDGITSAQLSALDQVYPDGVKSYPDQPFLREIPTAQGLTALRQEKVALVASEAGTLTLPEIEVIWWNTATGQQEVARVPERQLSVMPAKGSSTPPQIDHQEQNISQPVTSHRDVDQMSAAVGGDYMAQEDTRRWLIIVTMLTIGWVLTLLLWWRSSRRVKVVSSVKIPTIESLNAVLKKIKQACRNSDADRTKDALIQWGQTRWPENKPASLGELAARVDRELAGAIDELSHVLYSGVNTDWRGDALWQAFNKQQSDNKTVESKGSELAPLFRHQ